MIQPVAPMHCRSIRVLGDWQPPRTGEPVSLSTTDQSLADAVRRLEADNRRLRRSVGIIGLTLGVTLLAAFASYRGPDSAARLREALLGPDSVLQLRGLQIIDARGTTRVRLGAPLPGPIISGKEMKRAASISGMVVMDADGDERGGFAAADVPGDKSEVFIGLDTKDGQATLFLANPHDGGNLQIWDARGNAVRLYATGGSARILVQKEGKLAARVPADTTR